MYKLILSSAHAGPSLPIDPWDRVRRSAVALEKRSDAFSGQLDFLEKLGRIDPRVRGWLLRNPPDFARNAYVIVVPLGADESWEETINGDAFLREDLRPEDPEWGHKSFETYGKAFRHHQNSDPERAFGDIPFTVYNDEMDRVEGIWRLDRKRARDLGASDVIERAEGKGPLALSMGCKVAADCCSLCGNMAKSVAEYCAHVRVPGFGHIDPVSGRKMRVTNPKPKFFDLSDVTVNAAPEAHPLGTLIPEMLSALQELEKTSSRHGFILPSAVLGARRWGIDTGVLPRPWSKVSSRGLRVKIADLIKEVPVLDAKVIRPLYAEEPELDLDKIEDVNPMTLLSSLASLGIVCTPREFSKVMTLRGEDLPDIDARHARAIWPFASESSPLLDAMAVRHHVTHPYKDDVERRSIFYPHFGKRVLALIERGTEPSKPEVDIIIRVRSEDRSLALQYASYLKTMAMRLGELLSSTLSRMPGHASQLLGMEYLTKDSRVRESQVKDRYDASAVLPTTYILSRAGMTNSPLDVERSVRALHVPGVEQYFGGLLVRP